jgi:glucan phosphoethanolaminetransferase (alkaline phosphatase superfamily)
MEGAENQWIGLGSVVLFAAMVLAPFILTWINCDRPEPYLKRCMRTTVGSLIIIAASAAILMLFFQSHFPAGAVATKVYATGIQSVVIAFLAPLFGTDFLMRMKLKYKWHKARGSTEV